MSRGSATAIAGEFASVPVDTFESSDYKVAMNSTPSYDLTIEAWQTDTPDLPGSWRRTATTKGRWSDENGWLAIPVPLVPDRNYKYLRLEMDRFPKSNPNGHEKYVYPVTSVDKVPPYWNEIKIHEHHVRNAVPISALPAPNNIVTLGRVKLPPRRVQVDTTEPVGTPMERIDTTISRVRALTTDAEIRGTVLEVLESFRSHVVPSLTELESLGKIQSLSLGIPADSNFTVPLPYITDVGSDGKITLSFRGGTTVVDMQFGTNRAVDVVARGTFTIPDRETTERGMSDPVALAGVAGMFGRMKPGEA